MDIDINRQRSVAERQRQRQTDKKKEFLKWQPCHFPVKAICFVYVNLPTVLQMSFNKLASFPLPNINLHLSFYCGRPSFGFKQFMLVQIFFLFLYEKTPKNI